MSRSFPSGEMPEIQVSPDAPARRALPEAEKLPWNGKEAGKSGFSGGSLLSVLMHAGLFAIIFLVSGWPAVREDAVLPIVLVSAGAAAPGAGAASGGQGESGASSGAGTSVPPSSELSAPGASPDSGAEKAAPAAQAKDVSVPVKQTRDAGTSSEKDARSAGKSAGAAEPETAKSDPAQTKEKTRAARADSVSRTALFRHKERFAEEEQTGKRAAAGRKGAGGPRRRTAEKKKAAVSEPESRSTAAAQEERVFPRSVPAPARAAESPGTGGTVPASRSVGNGGTGNGTGRGNASGEGAPGTPGGGEGVFTLGQLDTPPAVIRQVRPEYPPEAQRRRIEGRVTVRLIVDTEGKPTQCTVQGAQPAGVFEKSALKAAEAMRFTPGRSKGRAVRTLVLLPFDYRLR